MPEPKHAKLLSSVALMWESPATLEVFEDLRLTRLRGARDPTWVEHSRCAFTPTTVTTTPLLIFKVINIHHNIQTLKMNYKENIKLDCPLVMTTT